jgi:hypothetical protein
VACVDRVCFSAGIANQSVKLSIASVVS